MRLFTASLTLLSLGMLSNSAVAQTLINTTTPLQSNSDSFYESFNVGWSVRGPNFFASFNSPAPPPFGGFNPNAGLTSGFAFGNRKFSGNLNFNFSQGYSRTSTTIAPSVTSMNGQPAFFFDGTVRPFVYSVVPVVGGGGPFFSVPSGRVPRGFGPSYEQRLASLRQQLTRGRELQAADGPQSRTETSRTETESEPQRRELNSSERASAAFSYLRGSASRSQSTARTESARPAASSEPPAFSGEPKSLAELYFRKGLAAETRSTKTARMYYRMAFPRATGDLRQQIDRRLQAIGR